MNDPAAAELPPAIRAMTEPMFYPHPVPTPVVLLQTHISYVLLAGEFAYKVKKAVDLGFLDFTTLERRRHYCHEELRLNRRGAPGLYLDVVSINRAPGDGGLALGGPGDAVEYAVRMRRFPPGSLLSERVHVGSVGEAEVRELAATVAAYHAAARADDAVAAFGEPDRVRAVIEDNYRHTRRFVGTLQTAERFEQTRAFTERFLETHRDAMLRRARSGRVRECHGDLHLANICRWDGRVLLFDCIEFNDAFRFVDVMYDVAFAAMDFEARGRPDLATTFRNEYAETAGDWEGLAVLPLYLCRHAYVRAKVNSLLSEDRAAGNDARRRAATEAERYYDLAYRYSLPRRGRLVLMSGVSGSGKSTLARSLASVAGAPPGRIGAAHVRSDAVRKHLAGVPLRERAGPEVYGGEMTRRTYERLLELGLMLAAEGEVVILDAKYDRADTRRAALDAAETAGVAAHVVACEAPPEVLKQRLRHRAGDVADATADLTDAQPAGWEPPDEAEGPHVLRVDATRPPGALADELYRRLGLGHPPA